MRGTTTSRSAVEVVEEIYAALAARDLQRMLDHLHPTFVVTQDERLPWGGRYVGHEGFVDFALRLSTSISSQVAQGAIFAADDAVYQYGRTSGTVRANGRAFDIPEAHRWVVRDGLAVEAHFAIDTAAMLDALGQPS